MTQKEKIIEAFRANGWQMTLGQMLQYPWGYEFRARKAEMKKAGINIWLAMRGSHPSNNLYRMEPQKRLDIPKHDLVEMSIKEVIHT